MRGSWSDVERILCVRLDNLGDVMMTTPAIRALKGAGTGRPARHVTLLGSSGGCEIARHVAEIDNVLAFDAPWVAAGRDAPLRNDIASRLAAYRFDAAVIFTCYTQSALPAAMMCGQAGIPRRLAHCRENPYGLLTEWVGDPEPAGGIRHEVERQLALVATVGATTDDDRLSVRATPAAWRNVVAALAARGVDAFAPYLVIHPGASAASRRWPPERFAEVAGTIAQRTGLPIVVTGAARESELVRGVVGAARALGDDASIHDLSGALVLDELIALVDGATLLVSNNTGPVHIAAARGTPVVDLYAQTNPQHTPWRVAQRVLSRDVACGNCQRSVCPEAHHACLEDITVTETVAAIESLLAEIAAGPERVRDPALAAAAPAPPLRSGTAC